MIGCNRRNQRGINAATQKYSQWYVTHQSRVNTVIEEFTAVRVLSFLTIVLALVWIGIARYAGNQFREMTEDP